MSDEYQARDLKYNESKKIYAKEIKGLNLKEMSTLKS